MAFFVFWSGYAPKMQVSHAKQPLFFLDFHLLFNDIFVYIHAQNGKIVFINNHRIIESVFADMQMLCVILTNAASWSNWHRFGEHTS